MTNEEKLKKIPRIKFKWILAEECGRKGFHSKV